MSWALSILPAASPCTYLPVWRHLAAARILGRRHCQGRRDGTPQPHSLMLVLLGAGHSLVRLVRFQWRQRASGGRRCRAGAGQYQCCRGRRQL